MLFAPLFFGLFAVAHCSRGHKSHLAFRAFAWLISEILLIDLRLHPHNGQVGQPIKFHPGLNHLSLDRHFLDHDPVARRIDAQCLGRLPGFFQLGDLFVRDVEEFQLGQSAGLEGFRSGRAGSLIEREQIFGLGAEQLFR